MAEKQWNGVLVGVDLVDIYMLNPVNIKHFRVHA